MRVALLGPGPSGSCGVGYVDLQTGLFTPTTGKAELVDTEVVLPGNGPEWAGDPNGNRIVYMRRPGLFFRLAEATFDGTAWQPSMLQLGSKHLNPLGNVQQVAGLTPILSLLVLGTPALPQLVWRDLDDPKSEQVVPLSSGATGGRWVDGELEIVFSAPMAGGRQAYHYDGTTGRTTQLTSDGGLKQTVFMWAAPEFGGERLFFASVKGFLQSQIRVYRFLDPDLDGTFEWTVIKTINPPAQGIFFWSPEPFVHNGKSYIYWVASRDPDQPDPALPSQVWMAAADPADPFYVSVSDPTLSRFRLDPELYQTPEGPFLYYNRFIPGSPQQYEGVYRVDTGLGPPQ